MNDNGIIYPKSSDYLDAYNSLNNDFLEKLELRAKEEYRPIIQRDIALFLQQSLRMKKPKHILELGTNFAYSTLCMALCVDESVLIDTIESLEENVIEAQKNIEHMKISNIRIHQCEAIIYLKNLGDDIKTDFVFIDANKSENQEYIELLSPKLKKGSVVIIDNVLWKGRVTGQIEISKRQKQSTKKIKAFNEWMLNNRLFNSQILPIGDGCIVAIKN